MQFSHPVPIRRPLIACALLALGVVLCCLLIEAGAAAGARDGKVVVKDARRENNYVATHPRIDIIRATGERRGKVMVHTIRMRKRVKAGRRAERPGLYINTRGGRRSNAEYIIFGSTIFKVRKQGNPKPIGEAQLRASGRTWRFRFGRAEIPKLKGYGWAAVTLKRNGTTADVAPPRRYAPTPR